MYCIKGPITLTAQSGAWDCGHMLNGIADSNPSGDKDVCLL
jgi:hypothetical protein